MKWSGKILLFGAGIIGSCVVPTTASASGISVMPDSSVIWQIINFLVLIWILNLVLYRPIRNVIAQRQEKMAGLDKSIERFEQDAQARDSARSEGLSEARANGLKEKNSMLEAAAAEEKKIIEEFNQKAQQTIAENKEKIAKDVESAAADLQAKVDMFAADIGRKMLGRDVV
jgi:F-type H+-transporting ATPase subunit b